MNAWNLAKWTLLAIVVLGLALGLARTFSGSEDEWVRDVKGNWVAHGHPAAPEPAPGYQPPRSERVLPWVIVGLAVAGLIGGAFVSRRRPASREGLSRDVRFFGTVSIVAGALAIALVVGLIGLGVSQEANPTKISDHDLIMGIAGVGVVLTGLTCLLLAALQAHGIRKLLEAHYDLKRAAALLQDTVERVAGGGNSGTGPMA